MVLVRTATVEDKMAVAQVHVHSWQVGYRGLIPDEYLNAMRIEDRAARYTFGVDDQDAPLTLVATEKETIVGFVTLGPSRDDDARGDGEILALYVDPDSWRRGIGKTLVENAVSHFKVMLFTTVHLWVLEGNLRAQQFYESNGWIFDGLTREDQVWGVQVNQMRFSRSLRS